MEDKKYTNLIAALAQFAKHNDAIGLDEFMIGYAGADWAAAAKRPLAEEARNTITITAKPGNQVQNSVMFQAPNNGAVAYHLLVFLIENLKDGFIVSLKTSAGNEIAQATGKPVPMTDYVSGLEPLPTCPDCGGRTVFHADSDEDNFIVQCTDCGRVGRL